MNKRKLDVKRNVQNLRTRRRNFVDRFKLKKGCSNCGYKEHAVALTFDHINPNNKIKSISMMIAQGSSIDIIKNEIRKCQVLCANCHNIKTKKENDNGTRTIKSFN